MGSERFVVVAVIDVGTAAVTEFQRYEDQVLPLLRRHGGELERRLRGPDGTTEVHVLSFDTETAWRGYLDDPERAACRAELADAPVEQRVLEGLREVG